MSLIIGIALVAWGTVECLMGRAWFQSRGGGAWFTAVDDGFVFWMVAGAKIVGGAVLIQTGFGV